LAGIYFGQKKFEQAISHWLLALEIMPDNIDVLNNIAWVKSAYENESFYKPGEAIEFAKKACELAEFKRPDLLDTLSVAYAADGKFSQAIETSTKAIKLAEAAGNNDTAEDIRGRLELYRAGKAYNIALLEEPRN
jgi:tetratricopeptide (TPR) repeat protein